MPERPILFSASMVRALLAGTKTQTRRIVKPQPMDVIAQPGDGKGPSWAIANQPPATGVCLNVHGNEDWLRCPYGKSGDHLRVRETFYAYGRWVTRYSEKKKRDEWHFIDMTLECDRAYQYDADSPDVPLATGRGGALPGWYKRPRHLHAACGVPHPAGDRKRARGTTKRLQRG